MNKHKFDIEHLDSLLAKNCVHATHVQLHPEAVKEAIEELKAQERLDHIINSLPHSAIVYLPSGKCSSIAEIWNKDTGEKRVYRSGRLISST